MNCSTFYLLHEIQKINKQKYSISLKNHLCLLFISIQEEDSEYKIRTLYIVDTPRSANYREELKSGNHKTVTNISNCLHCVSNDTSCEAKYISTLKPLFKAKIP